MVVVIDGILKTLSCYDTTVNAAQIAVREINSDANFEVVITRIRPTTLSR